MNALKRLSGPGKWVFAVLAFAAALFTAPAMALTISLPGFICSGATATTVGDTMTITCAGSGPVAGSFSISGPASLPASSATTTQIAITRSGASGYAGTVTVPYTVSNACTAGASPNPMSFVDMDAAPKYIVVNTQVSGICTVSLGTITATAGTPTVGTGSANMTLVDPNAAVSFQFVAPPTSATNVGASGPTTITVQRSGGTNGEWSVPYTMSGTLAPAGSPVAGTLTGTLNFPANSATATATLSYTPPATAPAGVALPAQLVIALGLPNAVAPLVSGQAGSASGSHTLTLAAPASGPPPGGVPATITTGGIRTTLTLSPLQYSYSPLPDISTFLMADGVTSHVSGKIQVIGQLPTSPPPPVLFEGTISRNIGDFTPTPGCYFSTTYPDGWNMAYVIAPYYSSVSTGRGTNTVIDIHDAASAAAAQFCWAPKAEGQWYVNVRWTQTSCSNCQMLIEYFPANY